MFCCCSTGEGPGGHFRTGEGPGVILGLGRGQESF